MPEYVFLNGKIIRSDKAVVSVNNRSFRYGDGFFETMKMVRGKILLAPYHFERLFDTLDALQFEWPKHFAPEYLKRRVEELAEKNNHNALARIRLTIFRGDGGLYDEQDNHPNYLIQTWALNPSYNSLNENGLVMDIFKDARKACDKFSHLKTNNYQPYTLGALWAKRNRLNDAVILNSYGRIADATIANIFLVEDGIVKTPALTEGCISGVMRRHLLKCLRAENIPVQEAEIEAEQLLQAREVFLTNAAYGIRWVKTIGKSNYSLQLGKMFYEMVSGEW